MKKNIKEPVRLRAKKLQNGNQSLYLDIYMDGNRKCEYLKLYLIPEKNREAKEHNRNMMALANSIKSKRNIELQAARFGFSSVKKDDVLFFDYFIAQRDRKTGTTFQAWDQTLKHLRLYERNKSLKLVDIDKAWVEGFRKYLDEDACVYDIDPRKHNGKKKGLGVGTKALYFQKLSACFNNAIKDGVIDRSPLRYVDRFVGQEPERSYLTIDELKLLASTDCDNNEVKQAFLFSALTGMRWSDISQLRWGDISRLGEGMRIVFRQQKTKGLVYLDISSQAAELLGESQDDGELAFPHLLSSTCTRNVIGRWVARSGIRKHITFHCARHTFAVMMLDLGTDIYTVSKLLGHVDLTSTQVYAKILDKNKQAAVARIPKIF
ncbi:MAG: site-specific integrase [Staphylococcus sp.]|nr:site-specific integrase [Staphylococcus sp.]